MTSGASPARSDLLHPCRFITKPRLDCTAFLQAIDTRGAFHLFKARTTANLLAATWMTMRWTSFAWAADGKPLRQFAAEIELIFPGFVDTPEGAILRTE